MANNSVVFEVIVTDKGTQKVVIKNLNELGDSVKKVQSRQKDAEKGGKDFFDTQKKGIVGTANSTKSFSKLAETIGSSSGVVGAYATLAANIFAVTAAFNALRNASQVEQVFLGLEAAGNRLGQTLSITARGLKEVTANAVSTEQSLRSTAQIIAAGFGEEQVIALGKAARDTSFALGRNLTDSLDRLTRGVVKLEPELLDELGIMTKITESNTKYAASLGKSVSQLSNFEKRQGFLNAVIAEADLKFGGLADSAGNSTAYDKLAANFADLTQNVLSFINTAAKPLASLLGSSQGALAGAALLFASGISRQLLPGLADLSKKSLIAAAASKEQAKQARAAAEAELKKAKAAGTAGVAAARAAVQSVNKGPKVFNESAEAISKGTASIVERDRAYAALTRSIRTHEAQMAKMDQSDTARVAAKAAMIAQLKAQQAAIISVATAEANAANTTSAATAQAMAAKTASLAASRKAYAADLAANALVHASTGKLSLAWKSMTQSVVMYSRAQATATGGAITGLGAMRTAAFAASVGIRAIGAAFLAAIPIIGQVVFVLGLLYSGFQALKSDAVKKAEQALADFNKILDGTNDKLAELNRTQQAVAPASQRVAQAMTIQSNAVKEIVDAYNEVTKAQASYIEGTSKLNKVASANDVANADLLNGDFVRAKASYISGIAQDSQILKATQEDVLGWSRVAAISGNKGITEVAKALDALNKIVPDAVEEVANLHGGWDRIRKLDPAKKQKELAQMLREVEARTGAAAERVKDMVENLRNADLAVGEFLRAAIQSTPYDKIVDNLDSVVNGIHDFEVAVARGEQTSSKWITVLAGMGSNLSKFLSPDTAKAIKATEEADKQVQSLQALEKSHGRLTIFQQGQLDASKETVKYYSARVGMIADEVEQAQQLFLSAQRTERTIKSQLILAQARMQANQQNYQITAQGEGARISAENRIKDLQAASLIAQKAILDASIAQSKVRLEQLKTEAKITDEMQKQGRQALTNEIAAQTQLINSIKEQAKGRLTADYLAIPDGIRQRGDKDLAMLARREQAAEAALAAAEKRYRDFNEFKGIQTEIAALEDASKSLANEIAAIFESKITPAEKLAAMAAKEVEIQTARLASLNEIRSTLQATNEEYLKQASLISGRSDSLGEQLRIIKATAVTEKANRDASFSSEKANLLTGLRNAQVARARASTQEEVAANEALQSYYQTQLDILTQSYNVDLQRIDAQSTSAQLEKAIFDSRKQGLEWQQSSLDYLQKSIDAQRELSNSVQDQLAAQTKLSLKRRGLEISDEGQQALEIRAAAAAYKLAVQEVEIKKSLIDLEYALLDAQREHLRDELSERRAFLADNNTDGRFNTRLAQLDTTLDRISNIDTSAIAENLKKSLDTQLETQKIELQTLMTPNSKGNNPIISFMEGIADRQKARREAQEALTTKRVPMTPIAKAGPLPPKTELDPKTNQLVSSNNNLISAIDRWIDTIKKEVQSSSAEIVSSSVQGAAKQALDFFISKGWTASQAAGIVGNLQQESGKNLDPKAKNTDAGIHLGIAQWSAARMADFYKVFGKGLADSTREEQLKFVQWELDNTEKVAGKMLKAASNVEQATLAFSKHYERAGAGSNDPRRVANARALVDVAMQPTITPKAVDTAIKAANPTPAEILAVIKVNTKPLDEAIEAANDNEEAIIVTAGLNCDPLFNLEDIIKGLPIPPITVPMDIDWSKTKDFTYAEDTLAVFGKLTEGIKKQLEDLGPEGAALRAVIEGMSTIGGATIDMLKVFDSSASSMADKITAVASVASAALGTIQSVLAASADAKIANIDREIAAEQKRDGKSADSIKKIESLEKKKDQIAKKQFNTNKKLMMAQAVISTAAGVAQALSYGPIAGPILAAVIAAMGAAQIAIIAGTSYQSTASSAATSATPSSLTIGKTGDTVDLAKNNSNVGGELGYLRGKSGYGSNSSNYAVIGSAYGGDLPRGYGNTAYMVGEKGPEILTPETPISVTPVNDNQNSAPIHASISISALDANGVEDILKGQRGNIISMLREAANANGQRFLEDVNVNVYTRPNVGRL